MDSRKCSLLLLLLITFSLHCSTGVADTNAGSVFFLDSPDHRYIRTQPVDNAIKSYSVSSLEVGAAISVLLGFGPPATLSDSGSTKLDEILVPNPFDRPSAVLMLEIMGVREFPLANDMLKTAFKSEITLSSDKVEVQLPGEQVSIVSLDEALEDYTDNDIMDLASWLGASYIIDPAIPLNGKLTIPLSGGSSMALRMTKRADREFVTSLFSLLHNMKRAIEMHQDLSQSDQSFAELIMGGFNGIKVLQAEYGTDYIVGQGLDLILSTFSRMRDLLEASYKGPIVGVILFKDTPYQVSERMLNVKLASTTSARMLSESDLVQNATNVTVAEVVLVRRTLAWITGIILLVSTLIGVYLLLNMPLTRDTLLYSNVKLD